MKIWQHVPFEDSAAIGIWAKERGVAFDVVRLYEGEEPATDDLLVILGGSMSAYDDVDFLKTEKRVLSEYLAAGEKAFGICLGAQLLASVMGARVYPSGKREAGWRNVSFKRHAFTEEFGSEACVFHWHGDTFDLPEEAVLLASNDAFENQMFCSRDGRVIGTQFHFETTEDSILALLEADGEYLKSDSPFVQSKEQILLGQSNIPVVNKLLFSLLDRWAGM